MAEGAGEYGITQLDDLINTDLFSTVNRMNPQTLNNSARKYFNTKDGLGFLVKFAKKGNEPQFVIDGSQAIYRAAPTSAGEGSYRYDIVVTQKNDPVAVNSDTWDFSYYYQVRSMGSADGTARKVLLSGDFIVRVQKDNFAKYALFTDHHGLPSGTPVWFTNKTNFAGPLHTNGRYNFALNPSGVFTDTVTQHLSKARFYNNGWTILRDADSNPPRDVPVFNAGFQRGESQITLASSVQKKDLVAQARGGDKTPGNGIFVANDGANLTGGIYIKGDAEIELGVDGSDNAQYKIKQGGITKIVTVDISLDQTDIQEIDSKGNIKRATYKGIPDGVDDVGTIIYTDGTVSSLKGVVQRDTEITVSSERDVVIGGNITYSDYTSASGTPGTAGYVPPGAAGAANLLGVVAWGGDVRVGTSAPDNVNIHGVLMARNGVFQVDKYNNTGLGPRGTATLLGGVITQFYGAFGLFNGRTGRQLSGYGRNFVYDSRTLLGKSPPYFPSMKTFIAFTNDLTDKVVFQEGGF